LALGLALSVALFAGCIQPQDTSQPEPQAPSDPQETGKTTTCEVRTNSPSGVGAGQTGVSNEPGSFSYSGQVAAKSATETFLWKNPSASAQVAWGGQAGTGTLKLTLQDICDRVVYENELSGTTTQTSTTGSTRNGQPGEWLVTLEFTAYTGQMGLSITSA
jgi:hypothetical protein